MTSFPHLRFELSSKRDVSLNVIGRIGSADCASMVTVKFNDTTGDGIISHLCTQRYYGHWLL